MWKGVSVTRWKHFYQLYGQNRQNRPTHLHSSPWHSKTEWNTATPIGALTEAMMWLHRVKIGPHTATYVRI